jgi:hypothetical protein
MSFTKRVEYTLLAECNPNLLPVRVKAKEGEDKACLFPVYKKCPAVGEKGKLKPNTNCHQALARKKRQCKSKNSYHPRQRLPLGDAMSGPWRRA